jgi:hypothetical protein
MKSHLHAACDPARGDDSTSINHTRAADAAGGARFRLANEPSTPQIVSCDLPAAASVEYLKRRGIPKTPRDLSGRNCLQFSVLSPTPYWEFYVSGKAQQFRVQGTLSSNSGAAMIDAAR